MSDIPLSKECCTIPAVVVEGYKPKGEYGDLGGFKTYTTGSTSASVAIVWAYDAFGYSNQMLQGADIVATATNSLVVMPDFLEGGLDHTLFPADTDEKKAIIAKVFAEGGVGNFARRSTDLNEVAVSVKSKYPSVQKIAAVGFCWGGKVAILGANQASSLITASAQAHPARLAKEDAEGLRTPHLVLASKDEPADDVKAFDETEKPAGSETHTYSTMHHGWMGARAKLDDEENLKEYKRGYEQLSAWLNKILA